MHIARNPTLTQLELSPSTCLGNGEIAAVLASSSLQQAQLTLYSPLALGDGSFRVSPTLHSIRLCSFDALPARAIVPFIASCSHVTCLHLPLLKMKEEQVNTVFAQLTSCSHLRELHLRDDETAYDVFTETRLQQLARMNTLTSLLLHSRRVCVGALTHFTHLQSLDLRLRGRDCPRAEDLAHLQSLSSLTDLTVHFSIFSDAHACALASIRSLVFLTILLNGSEGEPATLITARALARMPHLSTLSLSLPWAMEEEEGWEALVSIPTLTSLHIANMQLTVGVARALSKHATLTHVRLIRCHSTSLSACLCIMMWESSMLQHLALDFDGEVSDTTMRVLEQAVAYNHTLLTCNIGDSESLGLELGFAPLLARNRTVL